MPLNYKDLDREIDRDLGIKPPMGQSIRTFFAPWTRRLAPFVRPLMYPFRVLWKICTFPMIPTLSLASTSVDEVVHRSLTRRFLEGFFTRALLAPIFLAIALVAFVWYSTHPALVLARQTPATVGLYYRPIALISLDGQHLQGWYIPGLTADEVLRNGDDAIKDKRPGVVIVHGLGMANDQYLALASQLHEAGFCVLLLSPRGQGESEPAAVTFGLRERYDVLAGVNYLRDLQQVDAQRICVVGYGMGASAALEAALTDSSIAAVVAEAPWPSFEKWAAGNLDRAGVGSGILTTLYTCAFELTYRERTSQLDLTSTLRHLHHTSLLLVAHNEPDEAPATDLMNAANGMPGPHQVLVLDSDDPRGEKAKLAATATTFLAQSLNWTPSEKRLSDNLKRLIEARVK